MPNASTLKLSYIPSINIDAFCSSQGTCLVFAPDGRNAGISSSVWVLFAGITYRRPIMEPSLPIHPTQGLRDISLRGWGLSSPAVYQGLAISSTWTLAFLVLSWFLVRNKLWQSEQPFVKQFDLIKTFNSQADVSFYHYGTLQFDPMGMWSFGKKNPEQLQIGLTHGDWGMTLMMFDAYRPEFYREHASHLQTKQNCWDF